MVAAAPAARAADLGGNIAKYHKRQEIDNKDNIWTMYYNSEILFFKLNCNLS